MSHVYRVWMKDGYASLQTADDEVEARAQAIVAAREGVKGAAMTDREKRQAITVDYVEQLS